MHTTFYSESLDGRVMCRRRWEANVKIDLKVTGSDSVVWPHVAQNRVKWRAVVETVVKRCVYKKAGNSVTI
jgi:hypothetical protein